jgi:hypothetical protein
MEEETIKGELPTNTFALKKISVSTNNRYGNESCSINFSKDNNSYSNLYKQPSQEKTFSNKISKDVKQNNSSRSNSNSQNNSIKFIRKSSINDLVIQGSEDSSLSQTNSNIILNKHYKDNISRLNTNNKQQNTSEVESPQNEKVENNKVDPVQFVLLRRLAKSPTIVKRTQGRFIIKKPTLDPNVIKNDDCNYSVKSLGCIKRNSKFRVFVFSIVENRYFDYFILGAILINSLILGLDMSLGLNTPGQFDIFDFLEWFFYMIFLLECLMKITAWGFYSGKKAYVKDPFNIVDFLVITLSIWKLIPAFKPYKEFNVFRLLRPLRSISFIPGLKKMVTVILNSVKQLINLFLLMLFVFLFFGLFGVTVWAGLFSLRCRSTEFPENGKWDILANSTLLCSGYYECPANYTCGSITEIYDTGQYFFTPNTDLYGELQIPELAYGFTTFDNIFAAFLSIFQCITLSNWTSIMYNIQNGYHYYTATIYFIFLILVLSYFIMNFTIAIMMDNCYKYEHHKDIVRQTERTKTLEFDPEKVGNKLWNKTRAFINFLKKIKLFEKVAPFHAYHSQYKICYYCYYIMNQPIFNMIIYMFTIMNLIVLSLVTNDKEGNLISEETLNIFSYSLTLIYSVECLIKILGIGLKKYFTTGIDVFDFIVVAMSYFEIIFQVKYFAVLKVIRVYRLISLFSEWKTIAIIIRCISETVKEMGYYTLLLLILIYVLALIGMSFFKGKLKFKDGRFDLNGDIPYTNFENVYQASIAVFALLIGDDWQDLLYMTLRSPLTNKILCYVYFVLNIVILNIIMMNLVIAFLVNNFKKARYKYTYQEYMNDFLAKQKFLNLKRSNSSTNLSIKKLRTKYYSDDNSMSIKITAKKRRSSVDVDGVYLMTKHGFTLKDLNKLFKNKDNINEQLNEQKYSINKMYTNNEFKTHIDVDAQVKRKEKFSLSHKFTKRRSSSYFNTLMAKSNKLINEKIGKTVRYNNFVSIAKGSMFGNTKSDEVNKSKKLTEQEADSVISPTKKTLMDMRTPFDLSGLTHQGDFKLTSLRVNVNLCTRFKNYIQKSSLFIFHIDSKFRRFFIWLVNLKCFDWVILIVTLGSCVVLILDNAYLDPNSTYVTVLSSLDYAFSIIFFVEMFAKIIAFGLIMDKKKVKSEDELMFNSSDRLRSTAMATPKPPVRVKRHKSSLKDVININSRISHYLKKKPAFEEKFSIFTVKDIPEKMMEGAYFRSVFNILDFCVIIISLIYFISKEDTDIDYRINDSFSIIRSFKTLRVLRALRPLRMISLLKDLKVVVNCLLLSFNAIINMYIIGLFIIYIYAIVGLNLFSGTLGSCSIPEAGTRRLCTSTSGLWEPSTRNFDTISSSLLILFEISTTSGWLDTMHSTIAFNGEWVSIYFISFMIIGCVFVMNLAITVIVDNFNSLNERAENISLLSDSQKDYIFGLKYILNYKPIPHLSTQNMSKFRTFCYKLFINKWLSRIINALIIINTFVMCLRFDRDRTGLEDIQSYIFYFSTFIFNIEMLLGVIAYRRFYFIDAWNKFDFVVVILCNLSICLNIFKYFVYKNMFLGKFNVVPVLIRGIRILRVIRLINLNKQVKDYFYTLILLFPSLYNLGSLVLIILVIFSVIGMNLFGTVMYDASITINNNFKDFISSFIFLIKMTTGDNWGSSMYSLATDRPGCMDTQTYESLLKEGPQGCGVWVAYPFFIVFLLLNKMVIMNLFIAVVVDTFVSKTNKSDKIDDSKVKVFFELWGKYDRQINYFISPVDFVLLMLELDYPFGLNGDSDYEDEYDKSRILLGDIHISHNNKYFADDRQCIRILERLDILARDGKIHLIDAIVLVLKRGLFKKSIPHKALEDIRKYKRLNDKIQVSFGKYHKRYSETVKMETINPSHFIASKVILKFVRRWREKTRRARMLMENLTKSIKMG